MNSSRQPMDRSGKDSDMLDSQRQFRADWNGRHRPPAETLEPEKRPPISWGRTPAQPITGSAGD
jgi:hypothetical protein